MGATCLIKPLVKNKDGNTVTSKLFDDLTTVLGADNRAKVIEIYKAATNENWINTVADEAKFDENGEITLHSLSKLAGLNFDRQKELSGLNKKIKSGDYSYVEALQKARDFNKSDFGEDFLATVKRNDDGSYNLSVVENTETNRIELEKQIANNEKITIVVDTLRDAGVSVDFIDNNEVYNGKFSTENADDAINGLISLITISRNAENVGDVLFEEAAHFAIAALHDTKEVSRLLEMCNDRAFVESMGIFSDGFSYSSDNNYEAAGRILERFLKEGKSNGFNMFLSKIKNMIFKVFSFIKPNIILAKKIEAETLAAKIANEFFEGNANRENALENQMTLYSIDDSNINNAVFVRTQKTLTELNRKLKNISNSLFEGFKIRDYTSARSIEEIANKNQDGVYAVISGVTNSMIEQMKYIIDEINNISNSLPKTDNGVPILDENILDTKLPDLTNAYISICEALDSLHSITMSKEIEGNQKFNEFMNLIKSFTTLKADSRDRIMRQFAIPIAEMTFSKVIGKDSFQIRGKINWAGIRNAANKTERRKAIAKTLDYDVTMRDALTNVYGTDGFLKRLLNMNLKLSDMGASAVNDFTRRCDGMINKIILSDWSAKLDHLDRLAKAAGYSHDFSELIERDDNGEFTGNFIGPTKLFKYYEFRKIIIDNIKDNAEIYFKEHPDEFKTKYQKRQYINDLIASDKNLETLREESFITETFVENGMQFNKSVLNSEYSKEWYVENGEVKTREVKDIYINKAFENIENFPAKLELLNAIKAVKEEIDNKLLTSDGYSHGVKDRIPQIAINSRFLTKRAALWFSRKDILSNLKADFKSGDDVIPDENYAHMNSMEYYSDGLKRMPLYGIKRIDNASTDILTTLKLYTTMAVRYSVIKDKFNALSIAGSTLQERTDMANGRQSADLATSNSDIQHAIDKYLYNFDPKQTLSSREKAIKAILSTVFITKTILGNITSAFINRSSANVMWIKNFESDNYTVPNYIRNRLKVSVTGHRKIPFLKRAGRRDKLIMDYVNNLFGKNLIYENLRKSPWVKTLGYEIPMYLYGKGDELAQQAIYMSCLEYQKIYKVPNISNFDSIIENETYDNISAESNIRMSPLYVKKTNMKDIFWSTNEDYKNLSKEDIEAQKNKTFIKNGYIKNREDIADYVYLSNYLDMINKAIEENEEAERNEDESHVFISIEDINNSIGAGKLNEYYKAFNNRFILIDDEFGMPRTLKDIKSDIESALNDITVTEKDVMKTIDNITAESTEIQGLYYAGAKAKILEYSEFAGMAMLMGYSLGYFNKNFNSNYNFLTDEYENSKASSVLYTFARLTHPGFLSGIGVYDKSTEKYRRMKLYEWSSIALLATPALNQFTKIPQIKNTLKEMGYTDQTLRRMHIWGNLLPLWLLFKILGSMFANRDPERSAEVLSSGVEKQGLSNYNTKALAKFGDVEELDASVIQKIKKGLSSRNATNNIMFDLLCKPTINNEAVLNSLGKRFTKSSCTYNFIENNLEGDINNAMKEVDKYSDMLYDYVENLKDRKYKNPTEALRAACVAYGYNENLADDILDNFKESRKSGNTNTKMSYNYWLELNGKEENEESREEYDSLREANSKSLTLNFNLTDPKQAEVYADNVKAVTFKGIQYDKNSPEYLLCGAMHYLVSRVGMEALDSESMLANAIDIASLNLLGKQSIDAIYAMRKLSFILNDENVNTDVKVKKTIVDFLLHKAFFESDKYGNILQKDPDDRNSAEDDYATGAKFRDGYKIFDAYKNFNENLR